MITNAINDKLYIGQSDNIESRWVYHTQSINRKDRKHQAIYQAIYQDIKRYGKDVFSTSLLIEEDDEKERLILETEAILKYDTLSPSGYNTDLYPHLRDGSIYSQTLKCIITSDELRNMLEQGTFESVARHYKVSSNTIRKWCNTLNIPNKSSEYITEDKTKAYSEKMRKISEVNKSHMINARKVNMLDKDSKKIIKTFDTMSEAAKFVKANSSNSIYKAIMHVENRKTCKGYAWSYA